MDILLKKTSLCKRKTTGELECVLMCLSKYTAALFIIRGSRQPPLRPMRWAQQKEMTRVRVSSCATVFSNRADEYDTRSSDSSLARFGLSCMVQRCMPA